MQLENQESCEKLDQITLKHPVGSKRWIVFNGKLQEVVVDKIKIEIATGGVYEEKYKLVGKSRWYETLYLDKTDAAIAALS